MRLLIVGASLLLIAAATPAVSQSGGVAGCRSEQLRLSVQSQGENTTTWIGVSIRNHGRSCKLDGVMTFKLLGTGRLLRIAGNPLRVRAAGLLGAQRMRLVARARAHGVALASPSDRTRGETVDQRRLLNASWPCPS